MIKFKSKPIPAIRILDFDVEARPLSWINADYVSKEITAIACRFLGEQKTYCWALGADEPEVMLEGFRKFFDEAGMVTGHYIRGYDLPVINGAMVEYGLSPLGDKLTHDTKGDLIGFTGVSKSQESLAAMLGVPAPKIQMNQAMWRMANRLTPEGIKLTKERVVGDVEQHIQLREALMEQDSLGPPKMWYSASDKLPAYQA